MIFSSFGTQLSFRRRKKNIFVSLFILILVQIWSSENEIFEQVFCYKESEMSMSMRLKERVSQK